MERYHCVRCGMYLDYDVAKMKTHYKEGNPNCPSCHRVMEPVKKAEPETAAAR